MLLITFWGLSGRLWAQETRGPKVGNTAPAQASGQTWALIVGVSKYQYIDSLRYADALAFYNYLISPAGGSVPKSNIQLLVNEKATFGQLDRALGNLLDFVKPNDRVFVYFSGHGDQETKTIAQRGFLLTHDSFTSNYNSTAFAVIYLQDYIATLSTKNQAQVVMFLDACRAGKLAGSEIGGVQLTGQQLLKQVSNEVKFMACQANEVSLEGQQWGGGRGLFSYHLIRGLQGLADADQDLKVTLRELERYMEDHVTAEAAPTRQNPVLVAADKAVTMSQIDIPTLAAVRDNTKLPAFAAVQGRGFAEKVLTVADTTAQRWYADFHEAIAQKRLMDTTNSADWYFERLMVAPSLEKLHSFIKREFAAALLEESSKVLGGYLESKNMVKSDINYRRNIRYLEKTYQILGKSHFLYPNLRAKVFYYNGLLDQSANPDTALFNYRQAILADSTFSPAYNDLGVLLYLKRSYKEAKSVFGKGLKYSPGWSFLHLNYGNVLIEQHQLEEAEKEYRKAIELNPDEASAYKNYGNLLAKLNRFGESESAYKKSTELNPNDADVYINYGILLFDQKRYFEAELAYNKALVFRPNDAQIYGDLGKVLASQNRNTDAEAAFKRSIQLNPKDALVHFNYGYLLVNLNRQAEAELTLKKSIELNPNYAVVYNTYGVLLFRQNRYEEAEIAYKKSIALGPDYATVYGNYGNLLATLNRLSEAEEAYRKAIELNPNDANSYRNYGVLLQRQKRLVEAETVYQKAIQLKTDDANVYLGYGRLLVAVNRLQEAEIAYRKAIELKPNDPSVYNSYGILLNAQARFGEAEAAYKRSIELNANNPLVYKNYGNLLLTQKRLGEAENVYKRALELSPADAELYNAYGYILDIQNRLVEAENAFKRVIELNASFSQAYYDLARIKSRQNLPVEAISWLGKALEKGFSNFESISKNAALDTIREMPEFKSLMEKYRRN
ncbi:tetratricopeptide repeat protein [Runella sp.]|uniref:tetratricopeptide repeat protein n=1 Tax=Runella sp. TaxID=1960881 RepID=UPI00261920F9|nr:tetratricopeptide repeat protein [Runella sp.]